MDFRRHALILGVIEQLKATGSWTGKTHVQKTLFLLQETHDLDKEFTFVLYKHGPYSFDIESELEEMKSYSAVSMSPVPEYGVALGSGSNAEFVRRRAPLTDDESSRICRMARAVGSKNVAALERLATAVWVRSREGVTDPQTVARRVHELKPHVSLSDASKADGEAEMLLIGRSQSARADDPGAAVSVSRP